MRRHLITATTLAFPLQSHVTSKLRHRFRSASTPVDYKDVGTAASASSRRSAPMSTTQRCTAHQYSQSLRSTRPTSASARTSTTVCLTSPMRSCGGLTKKASALAHKMKHSPKADRTTTGITADAVILLANILRRLEDG